jgi:immune inhibitor A
MRVRTVWRVVSLLVVATLLLGLLPGAVTASRPVPTKPARVAIGAHRLAGIHLRPPSKSALMAELYQHGLPLNATPEQIQAAQEEWFAGFQKRTETWVNPRFQEWALLREEALAAQRVAAPAAIVPVTATVFAMAVDFGATEVFTIPVEQPDGSCLTETVTITGPLQGEIPPPPATDNFTLWYSPTVTADATFYGKLIFGYEGAGRARFDLVDPVDGQPGINLAGYTVQDYYDHVAGDGNVAITGTVVGWVTVDHSEGYYGADHCASGNHQGGAGHTAADLVADALAVFSQTHPTYWTDPSFWPKYDANQDGILDTFWIIHAGMGQEAGGGEQGSFALWSHSSDVRNYAQYPDGIKVYEGDPNTAADDIYVGPYTVQPENLDVGVLCEEFGHNFFGLPDLYTLDANNSIGDWAIMSGGAWLGWLGGTAPAGMPLWFRMLAAFETGGVYTPVNWQEPMVVRNYDDPAAKVTIYQLEKTPVGANKGVRVNLPPYQEMVPNLAGTGKGAYSGAGRDQVDITLTRQIAIPPAAPGILTFDANWEIEEDWDYGYVLVNGASIPDMDGVTTNYDPNGNNLGNGITGFGDGTLRFDLSAYAGQTVTITLRYKTDAAVTEAGWWIDNVALDGAPIDDFESAGVMATLSDTFPGWDNSDPGWYVVPVQRTFNRYYLVEWRSMTKYDAMIANTAYIHNYSDEVHGDVVSRIPYNMPAALVYYRDTKYGTTYAMRPNASDPPSYGSKYQLLIVDQNWQPLRIRNALGQYAGYWTGRLSAYDAGLTLQPSKAFTIPRYWANPSLPPQNYPAKDPVSTFKDVQGYYGGFFVGFPCPPGYACFVERDGSVVIPARGLYSTRVTNFYFNPLYPLYGIPWPPSWLGSGNPGDDNVQFGVNIRLLDTNNRQPYRSAARLLFDNYSVDFVSQVSSQVLPGGLFVTFQTEVRNVGTETAENIIYALYPDSDLQLVSINISGAPGVTASRLDAASAPPSPRVASPNAVIVLGIDEIPSGETATVTVVCKLPAPLSDDPFYLATDLLTNDGRTERGPWWLDVAGQIHFTRVPLVMR